MKSRNAKTSRRCYVLGVRRFLVFVATFVPCIVGISIVFVSSCKKDENPNRAIGFPDGFLFGTATAGFQVEMGCPTLGDECTDSNSDWFAYVTDPNVKGIRRLDLADIEDPRTHGPGHWELYETDFDLAKNTLHNNAIRMGIEWSRLFPEPTDDLNTDEELDAAVNQDALNHYRAMLSAARERGLQPLVTIHHYTLPTWIHDGAGCTLDFQSCRERGWLDRERIKREMSKFAGFLARQFGDQVDLWATQNEPFAVIASAFLYQTQERSNPPALFLDADAAREAFIAMVETHAAMTDALREKDTVDADGDGDPVGVGIVHAMAPVHPRDPDNELDRSAQQHAFYLWNQLMLDACSLGRLDDNLDGEAEVRPDLEGKLDWIGLNYKMSMTLSGEAESALPELSPLLDINPFNIDLTRVDPRGLYEMMQFIQQRYDLPIYITENNGRQLWNQDEELESQYVAQNLMWVGYAIEQGVDVRGYFYWSLLDNYEWNHGMSVDLGLFAIDANDSSKKRTARSVAELYGSICEERAVGETLRERYPVDLRETPTGGVPADGAGRF